MLITETVRPSKTLCKVQGQNLRPFSFYHQLKALYIFWKPILGQLANNTNKQTAETPQAFPNWLESTNGEGLLQVPTQKEEPGNP